MNPFTEMDDSQWSLLVQDVKENFDEVTIKRGFAYFKQGRVTGSAETAPVKLPPA
ncbi:hypothetical protein N6H14_15510 [Paenibacillus sp. CC-CFT747]|nr:hypothetical protein N6H14_15510 [Paenibacillus sp. CC-CFT747]